MKELNRELFVVRDELKETNYNNQVIEKRLLKTQEDYEMIRSKFETFKDIEIVNCAMICSLNKNSIHVISDYARIVKRRKKCVRRKNQEVEEGPNGFTESVQAANYSYRQFAATECLLGKS